MHRIVSASCVGVFSLVLAVAAPAQSPDLSLTTALVFTDADGRTMPYRLFTPPDVDSGGPHPLVLFLHGSGESGTDNLLQVQFHIDNLIDATQSAEYRSEIPRSLACG